MTCKVLNVSGKRRLKTIRLNKSYIRILDWLDKEWDVDFTWEKLYEFTEAGNWDEYKEYVELILNEALYQTEMGEEIRAESTKVSAEQLFKRYRFVTLSTCRTWVGRDARMVIIAVKDNEG